MSQTGAIADASAGDGITAPIAMTDDHLSVFSSHYVKMISRIAFPDGEKRPVPGNTKY